MNWFRSLWSRHNQRGYRQRHHALPQAKLRLESLEDRCLLAAVLDANQKFIQVLYQDDLGRAVAAAEVNQWLPVLVSQGQAAVVNVVEHSAEARTHLVRGMYSDFLGRKPGGGEEQGFVNFLLHGSTQEQVAGMILGSAEFFSHAPQIPGVGGGMASNLTFVQGLFHLLLNRAGNAAEVNGFVNHLQGLGQPGVAGQFLRSAEFRGNMIRKFYGDSPGVGVLHRSTPPSDAEVNSWVGSGSSVGIIHSAFEASAEKFGLGQKGLDANQRFIQLVYREALGRTGSSPELTNWEQVLLAQGTGAVVNGVNLSTEGRTRLVKSWYASFLGRTAAQGEEQGFVAALVRGGSEEQFLTAILASDEYFNHSFQVVPPPQRGNDTTPTNRTFVEALYIQLLNRLPSNGDVSFWSDVVSSQGRGAVAGAFLGSAEFRGDVVRTFYSALLQRSAAPTDGEVKGWVNSGQGLWAIQRGFEASLEIFTPNVKIGAMGDSLTDPYSKYVGTNPQTKLPYWGSNGDQNWVEQLQAARAASFTIDDEAKAGATSADLLSTGQLTAVANQVAQGRANYVTVIVGVNDIGSFLATVLAGGSPDATPFVNRLVTNVQTALDTIQSAGKVRLVVANVPDISLTPQVRLLVGNNTGALALVTNAVASANLRIEALAATRGIPVVDAVSLEKLAGSLLSVGGKVIDNPYAPDGLHPGTVLQGLLANTILEAAHQAYGLTVTGLKLSDQEILASAKISPDAVVTYFDVSGYVKFTGTPQTWPLVFFAMA